MVNITPPKSPEAGLEDEYQRRRGRPEVRVSRTKAYRKIKKKKLKEELKKRTKEAEKYLKRLERQERKTSQKSPWRQRKVQLKGHKIKKDVKKELLFNSIVVQSIRNKMRFLDKEKDKQVLSKVKV